MKRPLGAVVAVRMPKDLAIALDAEAIRRQVPMSQIVREALEAWLTPCVTQSRAQTLTVQTRWP